MCCSVLQCVAVCCSVLRCIAVCCSVLHGVVVCCSVLQCVRSLNNRKRDVNNDLGGAMVGTLLVETVGCSALRYVAVRCSAIASTLSVKRECFDVLQCMEVCCSLLQPVAACCSAIAGTL